MIMNRPIWDEYFIEIAGVVAKRATCLRRHYGAVIVKNNKIISTGYNGAPVGEDNCTTIGACKRQELKIPSGERYELCRSVHAEANAILQAESDKMDGATLYISGWDYERYVNGYVPSYAEAAPCMMCCRLLKNAKIKEVKWRKADGTIKTMIVSEMGC